MTARVRTRLIVALAAAAAASLVVGGTLLQSRDETPAGSARSAPARVNPDSPAALAAETRRHPDMAPGRPPFVADVRIPRSLAGKKLSAALPELARRARNGGVRDWLLYGSILQRAGRPISAREAFDKALALAPGNLAAETAAAVGRFTKDDPSLAFSRLGPLASAHPRAQVVRFHLGLMLLWIRQVAEARRQLRLAYGANPRSFYGHEAGRLLQKLHQI